ncbi:MAG: sulfatase-like hydrolase/transferase, partial [Alphaproteobacteria bacterium]|nr:sulfatase-like hydrolase/transferase [Alphaproteobacteria bacterium]
MAKKYLIRRRTFTNGVLAALGSGLAPNPARALLGSLKFEARNKLNVLLVTADDMDWESSGLFNPQNAHITPNINQLGKEGVSFKRSHVVISACWQSRTAMFTGRFPHRNGTTAFRAGDEDIAVLPELLQRAGYLTGLAGKTTHTLPNRHDTFDRIWNERDLGGGRSPDRYYQVTKAFIAEAKNQGKPFFLNLNSTDPHRPFSGSPEDKDLTVQMLNLASSIDPFDTDILKARAIGERIYDPSEIYLPKFLPDIPEIRDELSFYYSSVARADKMVGRVMEALAESGMDNNTLVIFLSDNGIHMPFAKANVYPFSTAASLIIRCPSIVPAREVDDKNFINTVDLMPTILDFLDMDKIDHLDGNSFKGLLVDGIARKHMQNCFTYRHEDHPMRAAHDAEFSYIYNLWSDGKTEFQKFFLNNPSADAMRRHSKDDPAIAARYNHFVYRQK